MKWSEFEKEMAGNWYFQVGKPKQTDREIWDKAVAEGKKERHVDIAPVDKAAIRHAMRESRWQHTKRVKSILP